MMPSSIAWCAGFELCSNLGANRLIRLKWGIFCNSAVPKRDPSLTPPKKSSVHGGWSRESLRSLIRPAFKRPWGKATSDVRHSDASFLRSGAPRFFLNFICWRTPRWIFSWSIWATLMMACTYWSSLYWLNIADLLMYTFKFLHYFAYKWIVGSFKLCQERVWVLSKEMHKSTWGHSQKASTLHGQPVRIIYCARRRALLELTLFAPCLKRFFPQLLLVAFFSWLVASRPGHCPSHPSYHNAWNRSLVEAFEVLKGSLLHASFLSSHESKPSTP